MTAIAKGGARGAVRSCATTAGFVLVLAFGLAPLMAHAAGVALFDPKDAVSSERAREVLGAAEFRTLVQTSWAAKNLMVVPLNLAAMDSNVITVPIDGQSYEYVGGPKRCDGARVCVWRGSWSGGRGQMTLAVDPAGSIGGRVRHLGRSFEISGMAGSRYQVIKETEPAAGPGASGAAR